MTAVAPPTLVVSECFGPTIQGEGPSSGRRCSFIRLGGCNLSCSWCDTPYTWDAKRYDLREELTRRPVAEIARQVAAHRTSFTVITGGEPLMHQRQQGWTVLLALLGGDIEIETNGTIAPTAVTTARCRFNVSPKLAHSGDPEEARIKPDVLAQFAATGRAAFKFVVRNPLDLNDVEAVCALARIPHHLVWIMPEGITGPAVVATGRYVADAAVERGFNLTTRLHILLWPSTERGR
jgi:organic radical activating enzyme